MVLGWGQCKIMPKEGSISHNSKAEIYNTRHTLSFKCFSLLLLFSTF